MKFMAVMNKEFRKQGQTLQEFHTEVKALTPKDREDFVKMFKTEQNIDVELS